MRKWFTFAAWCFFCLLLSYGQTSFRPFVALALTIVTLTAFVLLILHEVLQ